MSNLCFFERRIGRNNYNSSGGLLVVVIAFIARGVWIITPNISLLVVLREK